MFANVVDGADIGMIQRGCGLGLALKTRQGLRVSRDFIGQELQGDEAMQPRVLSLVNHTHPAAAEFFNDAVVRDGRADHWARCYVGEIGKSTKREQVVW